MEAPDTCVVELDCGHARHVRDRPPLERHGWVREPAERAARIGQSIECGRCEQLQRPESTTRYREGPPWTQATIPAGLRHRHTLKAGTWGELVVLAGHATLRYFEPLDRTCELGPGEVGVVPPQIPHELEASDDVRLRLDFYR